MPAARWPAWVMAALLAVAGLAWRATFLAQGFAPTDEGFLQSLGMRIVRGEVPYRDFDFGIPPLSIYREAALIRLLGDSYTILAGRWVFAAEATLASVFAFVVLRSLVNERAAFLVALPTVFFSVLLYYFPNYTYDGEVLLVAALACLVQARSRWSLWGIAAGLLAAGGFLSKTNFLGFVPVLLAVTGLRALPPFRGSRRLPGLEAWPSFLTGFFLVCGGYLAAIGAAGALSPMLAQWSAAAVKTAPTARGFAIWQDLPDYLSRWDVLALAVAIGAFAWVATRTRGALRAAGLVLLAAVLGWVLYITADRSVYAVIARGNSPRPLFLLVALDLTLIGAVGVAALSVAGELLDWPVARRLPPFELPVLAVALQYLAQFAYAGAIFYYVGSWLTVPTILLGASALARRPGWPGRLAPLAIGAWFMLGSALMVHFTVYEDAPRYALTAHFRSAKLAGVSSRPANVQTVDGAVAAVEEHSRPGDPILALPDYPGIYFLTDRVNPTRTEWFNPTETTPAVGAAAVVALEADPPKVVLVQGHRAWDVNRDLTPPDYENQPGWAPIYAWVTENYRPAEQVGDITVYLPKAG